MKITDNDIRLDYLIEIGFSLKEAREYIIDNPKPVMYGEHAAILSVRIKELGIDFVNPALEKLTIALDKFKKEVWNK